MPARSPLLTPRMVEDYCRVRLSCVLPPSEVARFREILLAMLAGETALSVPTTMAEYGSLARATGISAEVLETHTRHIQPILDALSRHRKRVGTKPRRIVSKNKPGIESPSKSPAAPTASTRSAGSRPEQVEAPSKSRRGPAPKPIVEHPEPVETEWRDPASFGDALTLHMTRHGDTARHLRKVLASKGLVLDAHAFGKWRRGESAPRTVDSFAILTALEHRYRLPAGYFKAKLPHPCRATRGNVLAGVSAAERRRLAWHLPDDFGERPLSEQEEILSWVREVIITGSTEYRRFQAAAIRTRYAVRFNGIQGKRTRRTHLDRENAGHDPDLVTTSIDAPPALEEEMRQLLHFKTATLTRFGLRRNGVWGAETASQKVEHLGLMFGALAASPRSGVRGYGAPIDNLCFGMLVFPAVWDWNVQWRERRRGFYTKWEMDMLTIGLALTRPETGWLRQSPQLAERLHPIPGLISEADIAAAKADWAATCDEMHKHGRNRVGEIQRVARIHRDPFEPILPVLEADSPLGEYRKIAEEIVRLMPDERLYPRAKAEAVRSFLMLRLGLHLGVRQRNMRELLVCLPGDKPRSERQLEDLKRGELRWSDRDNGWEVLIPAIAFKNATSSFFGSKPYRLVLPDLGGLYEMIEVYLKRHRARLLAGAADPGTFFVKTAKKTSTDAAYNQTTFYEAWRLIIQRYGIYNPYTGRGVIKGLLPHGPHNVRDVLATHILKQTGSYEQASYAIQDTPDMVAKHYGRFLPQDKAAIAAQILNQVWEAA